MDWHAELRVFVQVARRRSFALASREVGLTPSAASKAVARLERDLGVRLLKRTTRRVALTPAGSELLDEVTPLLEGLATARRRFHAGRAPAGRLAIDCPVSLARWLTASLPSLLSAHPALRPELRVNDGYADLLAEGVDVALRIGPVGGAALVARRIGATELGCWAAPAYLERHGTPRSVDDLRAHACLVFRSTPTGRLLTWRFRSGSGADVTHAPEPRASFNTGEALADAAMAGLGIAQLFAVTARPRAESGRLVPVLAGLVPPPVPISVVYAAHARTSPNVRAFTAWVADAARGMR